MPIITLTTDWGTKDYYLASLKGAILKQIPEANIIDVSHDITPFDLSEASYILRNSWRIFLKVLSISLVLAPKHHQIILIC